MFSKWPVQLRIWPEFETSSPRTSWKQSNIGHWTEGCGIRFQERVVSGTRESIATANPFQVGRPVPITLRRSLLAPRAGFKAVIWQTVSHDARNSYHQLHRYCTCGFGVLRRENVRVHEGSCESQRKENFVNQTEKRATHDYRDNVPVPFEHAEESHGAQHEREVIEHLPLREENMNPEPDRQV